MSLHNTTDLSRAATESRGLSMDAVAACHSGHLGLPLGSAEMGAVLYGNFLKHNPAEPLWINRDRFVLSAGHGSMFLYSWLHLAGFDLPLEEVKAFRKLHSKTPGHPEFGETVGVEATTGPLGQGSGNIVGMAVAAKMAAAHFNTPEHTLFNHFIVGLAGDGCLQEGISHEAASFAGRFGLDNIIMLYDSNDVTLDAMASKTQNEDTFKRYEAANWEVFMVKQGNELAHIAEALDKARASKSGKPKLIICKTVIAKGIAEVEGTAKGHGEAGVKFIDAARKLIGLPEEKFFVSPETKKFFAARKVTQAAEYAQWQKTFAAWAAVNPAKADLLKKAQAGDHGDVASLLAAIPEFGKNALATRVSGETCINAVAKASPLVLSGSADLHGSTKNYIKDVGDFDIATPAGRNLYFGIREHAMGAIVNGIAYHGIFKGSGATFLTFSDYLRPAIRIAALAKLQAFYIFTHDSVGVGEDGPTHQPVETVSALRCIPNLDVMRPADAEETAAAFAHAVARRDGPVALILSRQNVPSLDSIPVSTRRQGTLKGAYIARKETVALTHILIGTGSELQLALAAAEELGAGVRVVSMPSMEAFARQSKSYQEEVLPSSCAKRVSIEAGVTISWGRYVGLTGKALGTDRFGLSAPGDIALKECGMTKEAVVAAAKAL
ncbi:MAG: transketolase [Opitutia bacterium]|nr:transketolase [Opitutales bacterium]PHX68817.1 MAG: transketolase [Opitutae bacterium]